MRAFHATGVSQRQRAAGTPPPLLSVHSENTQPAGTTESNLHTMMTHLHSRNNGAIRVLGYAFP